MSVPGRVEAASLLLSLGPAPWALRHARGVAEVAAWIARRARGRGNDLDRPLVEAAALLHDADKLLPAGHPLKALPHGAGSAAWLVERGHPALAPLVVDHPVTRLGESAALERLHASPEAAIVAYADKRVAQRLAPLDARFRSWRRRYPASSVDELRARAEVLETLVCRLAGVHPLEIDRLRWTGAALRSAEAAARWTAER
jgi:hypothetical protein